MVAVAEDEADQGEITINDDEELDDIKMAVDPGQPPRSSSKTTGGCISHIGYGASGASWDAAEASRT